MLEPTSEIQREKSEQVLLANLTLEDLRQVVRSSMAEGFKDAMTVDAAERFWSVGLQMMQAQARLRAGDMVLGGVKKVARLGFWGGLALVGIYMVGGWHLVVTVFKAVFFRE